MNGAGHLLLGPASYSDERSWRCWLGYRIASTCCYPISTKCVPSRVLLHDKLLELLITSKKIDTPTVLYYNDPHHLAMLVHEKYW